MKTLKIALVFLAVLGLIVFFFLYESDIRTVPLPPIEDNVFEDYRKQFEHDWEQKGDWDKSTFDSHCDLINQLSTHYQTAPLKDLNTSTAVEIVYAHIFPEWKSPNCKKTVIDGYVKAIKTITDADENALKNPSIIKIKDVNNTYQSAYKLAHSTFGLTPDFNGTSWNSFSSYSNGVISKKDKILGSSNYREYLSNIVDITDGLNSVPNRLSAARGRFYSDLAVMITKYYGDIQPKERTREKLNQLRSVRSKFENEYHSVNLLDDFVRKFSDDVENNENE